MIETMDLKDTLAVLEHFVELGFRFSIGHASTSSDITRHEAHFTILRDRDKLVGSSCCEAWERDRRNLLAEAVYDAFKNEFANDTLVHSELVGWLRTKYFSLPPRTYLLDWDPVKGASR